MDVEGVMVDAGMAPIRTEVETEVVVQTLHDLLILSLVMSMESEVIWPVIVRRLEI